MNSSGPASLGRRRLTSSLGIQLTSLIYISVLILLPLAVILQDGFSRGLSEFWHQVTLPIAAHAIRLTLWTSGLMTLINGAMGLATAYVLVRYEFPLKRVVNVLVDLPLAIPTLVTGVMLVVLYGPQAGLGSFLKSRFGWDVIFAPPGIVLALLFVTFPFVVRSVQPVLAELDREQEDAAATMGASPWTTFWRVVFPNLSLPLISGSMLAFSRAVGEFGSVVIVAGNIPLFSQVASVYVLGQVESENRLGASAVSVVLIGTALAVMWLATRLVRWLERRP